MYLSSRIRLVALGLAPEKTAAALRGFRHRTERMRARIEAIVSSFSSGYHGALQCGNASGLEAELESIPLELRGFAYEGAAMGLALLDCLWPWPSNRLGEFLTGAGEPHLYMGHVGAGWAWARLPFGRRRMERRLDPLLAWLAYDGWGFHEGFFHWPKYIRGQTPRGRLKGYQSRVFDQGLGRSLWFVEAGDPEYLSQTVAGFPAERQPDLWSGIGLAATYAGIIERDQLENLRERSGAHWPHLAQGAAFAAKARQRAGNVTDYTNLAARTLTGISAIEAARLCDSTLENLPAAAPEPAYELWRQRLQRQLLQFQSIQPQEFSRA